MDTCQVARRVLLALTMCCAILTQAPSADAQDLFDSVVQKFPASDTGHVTKNLPFARPRVLPGAIFTTSLRFPIAYGSVDDPAIIPGPPTEYEGRIEDEKRAGFIGELVSLFYASAAGGVVAHEVVHLSDVRYLSMDYEHLIEHVRNSSVAMQEMRRGRLPLVVSAAVVSRVTVSYVKGEKAAAEAWAKFRNDTVKIGGNIDTTNGNMVSVTSAEPIIVAFETRTVSFDWDSPAYAQPGAASGTGQPLPPIKLSDLPFPAMAFAMRESAAGSDIADVSSNSWAAVDPSSFVTLLEASKKDPKGIDAIGSWARDRPKTFPEILDFAASNPDAFAYIGADYAGNLNKYNKLSSQNQTPSADTTYAVHYLADVGKFGYSNPQALLTAADWAKDDPIGFDAVVKLGRSNPAALKVWGGWAEQNPEEFRKFASSNDIFSGYASTSGPSDWAAILTSIAISHPREFESIARQLGPGCTR